MVCYRRAFQGYLNVELLGICDGGGARGEDGVGGVGAQSCESETILDNPLVSYMWKIRRHTFGSSKSSFSHSCTVAAETFCWYFVGVYLGAALTLRLVVLALNSRKPTGLFADDDIAILLVHGAVILDLESLQALYELLVDGSIRWSRLVGTHFTVTFWFKMYLNNW